MSENLYERLSSGFPADRTSPCFLLGDGTEVSYGALEEGAARVAGRLIAEGVEPGDRIAMQVEKSIEAVMIYLGTLKAGAVFLPLNSAYTAERSGLFSRRRRTAHLHPGCSGVCRGSQRSISP